MISGKRLATYIIAFTLLAAPMAAAPKGWEPVKTERADAKTVSRDSDVEVKSASGVIIITANHPVQVKIFTILGRLVSNETVTSGSSQLQLPAHGVYIVKIGEMTCKVAV